MIIDLKKFTEAERPFWNELESVLKKLEDNPGGKLRLEEATRLHYLYERASAGLGKLMTFAVAPETRLYLESLVARAYTEVHETREQAHRFSIFSWFFQTFPQTFRKQFRPFALACGITAAGLILGAALISLDPSNKSILLPFQHLHGDPSERVAREEQREPNHRAGGEAEFSAYLMTHNTRVSILTLSLGMTYGVGTVITLFYNGVILGAVCWDYLLAGQAVFLLGWLLPHGVIEIPAILIAGQAGLLLAKTLIGTGRRARLRDRLRTVSPDLVTLVGGVACLLVWAGLVEGFISQRHQPELPYVLKISFGMIEFVVLLLFLRSSGRGRPERVA